MSFILTTYMNFTRFFHKFNITANFHLIQNNQIFSILIKFLSFFQRMRTFTQIFHISSKLNNFFAELNFFLKCL